ncbi:cilia- and flagella-associated protein 69-like, partial [Battus philenor]|uniref:cilia- and flagella-associated protein 69-like n=1 Tax=Battus philenor TaxID=42288 RepID=UPI0035CF02AC
MEKRRSSNVLPKRDSKKTNSNRSLYRNAKGDNNEAPSYTQYFKRDIKTDEFIRLNSLEVIRMKRNLPNQSWVDPCPPTLGWEITETLVFMMQDPVANQHVDRLQSYLKDFAEIAKYGYNIHFLDSVCIIIDYLCENLSADYPLREEFKLLLRTMNKPILLNAASDVTTHFQSLTSYVNFMGYLLIRIVEDDNFDVISKALIWHLSAPDSQRGQGDLRLNVTLAAATDLNETIVRMLALATCHRFPTFLELALLLACDQVDNCLYMINNNIFENIFLRFNPYFPDRALPIFDTNPLDPQDINIKLGASSQHMSTTMSLLLVLLKTIKNITDDNPKFSLTIPCPDTYSQRCFIWAYRYECRARDHRHERITLTVIASCLLHCFGERLTSFGNDLMPDVLSLSVQTEVPVKQDWTGSVIFNTSQPDVRFKLDLLYLSVKFYKTFPYNKFMMASRHWLIGLMYLLDPLLCKLRRHWSSSLYADLRDAAFKALICILPIASLPLIQDYGLIRRLMWYIEWYSVSPYELSVLYWCLRVLQVATCQRKSETRSTMLKDLFDSHGIIIIVRLCHNLLDQKTPPVEKSQVIITLCLRLLTSSIVLNSRLSCCVYPDIKWPSAVQTLSTRMINIVLHSLQKHLLISDRWIISLLNFIWETIIWNDMYRANFVADDGVFKLLDIISVSRPAVQCLALALLCDVARAGKAVGQLVTWRASSTASDIIPNVVRRGATIANLLAAIFRDECDANKIKLDNYGIIQNLECPLMSRELLEQICSLYDTQYFSRKTLKCLPAADLAGSRMPKVYALLHMLSKDLAFKVSLADEAYNLYKNIKLPPQDEIILLLCSHYLTIKLNETWFEAKILCPGLLPQGVETLEEFSQIERGWGTEIKKMQERILQKSQKEDEAVECSFYEFLSRVRLNTALDALREVRCMARSSDRFQISHALLHDAV